MFWEAYKPKPQPRLRDGALANFAGELSVLLGAGIRLPRALEILSRQIADRRLRRILIACREKLMAGTPLWTALREIGGFPPLFREIVRAGEENGRLDAALTRLSAYYGNRRRLRERIRSALIYPTFLILLTLLVGWIAAVWLLPALSSLLFSLGASLPLPTRILLKGSEWISTRKTAIPAVLSALILICPPLFRLAGRIRAIQAIGLHLPVIGRILRLLAATQFASALALLADAGILLTDSLRISAQVIGNREVARTVRIAAGRLESGECLGDALRDCRAFPPMLTEMARVGWESGRLAEIMREACEGLESDLLSAADRALSLLEPLLILLAGLMVALLMLAIFVPIVSAYSTVGTWI